jgi:hypothetical protein
VDRVVDRASRAPRRLVALLSETPSRMDQGCRGHKIIRLRPVESFDFFRSVMRTLLYGFVPGNKIRQEDGRRGAMEFECLGNASEPPFCAWWEKYSHIGGRFGVC